MTSKKVGPNFWEVPGFSFFSKNYKDIKTVEKLCSQQSGHEIPAFDSTNKDVVKREVIQMFKSQDLVSIRKLKVRLERFQLQVSG